MDENKSIGVKVKTISDLIRQTGDAAFAKYDLTEPQVAYINYIRRFGGSISQRELEKTAGVSHPTIVGIVSRLREKGYVEVRVDDRDRRNRIVSLTAKAENVAEKLAKGEEAMDARIVYGMTPEEKREFSRLLGMVEANLRTEKKERKEQMKNAG